MQTEAYWRWLPRWFRAGLESVSGVFDQRRPAARRLHKLLSGAGLKDDEHLIEYFRSRSRSRSAGALHARLPAPSGRCPGHDSHARFLLMSMAAGVEVRVPFAEPYLPHDVIYRPKTGFGAPLRRWMQHDLRELLGDALSAESLKRRGLFEPADVQRLIAANDTGKVDASYTLLSLLCVEIWCRSFLDFPNGRGASGC